MTRLGDRRLDALEDRLCEREAMSPLLPTYEMTDRVMLADFGTEYGVKGAAAIARASGNEKVLPS